MIRRIVTSDGGFGSLWRRWMGTVAGMSAVGFDEDCLLTI